jgi:membrane associated rhomboid family serine protease
MVAQAPDRRTGRLAGAAGIALLLAGLTLLLEPPSWRPAAAALLVAGLAVGAFAAMRLRSSDRLRTPMERLNDAAFIVVIAIVALIAVRLARPWTAALPGLVGGFLLGRTLRPQADRPGPGRAGTPPPADPGAPDSGG